MFSNYVQIPVHPLTKIALVKWGGFDHIKETPDMTDILRNTPDAKIANLAGKIITLLS